MTPKSPFLIYKNFVSASLGEKIVDDLETTIPDTNKEGKPQPLFRHHDGSEEILFERIQSIISDIEKYYGITYHGTEKMVFEWFPTGSQGKLHAENSDFLRKKWVRTRERDITAVLFLSDYNTETPFDSDYEVYGGKLEFPQHKFGFNPNRGTIVIFPSVPHFINVTSMVQHGDLYQVRIHMAAKTPFLYDPTKFPGTFEKWFDGEY